VHGDSASSVCAVCSFGTCGGEARACGEHRGGAKEELWFVVVVVIVIVIVIVIIVGHYYYC
jgi:hypothetical protein